METWYMAGALVIVSLIMVLIWANQIWQAKRQAERQKLVKKEASKAKRANAKARKVGLALSAEQQARAEGMNIQNTQNTSGNGLYMFKEPPKGAEAGGREML